MCLTSVLKGSQEVSAYILSLVGLWYLGDALPTIGKDLFTYLVSRSTVVSNNKNIHLPI